MKGTRYILAAVALMVCSCGEDPGEQSVSAMAVMPENPLVAMAVADPCVVVANLDGYIAEGIPMLGENFLENTLSGAIGVDNLEALMTEWGLDPHGTTVFFMEAMTPATIGLASGASDATLFISSLEEQGAVFEESDPIEGVTVKSAAIPSGNIFVAGDKGLLLVAGSRSTLTAMLGRLDPENDTVTDDLAPATFYYRMELGSIGPMAAAQLEMVRPQILSEMAETGGPGDEMGMQMIGIYFDAISMFLTQTESIEASMVIGPEDIHCESYIDFVPGSDLASVLCAPVEISDLTGLIPEGDVIMARASVPPELTVAVVNAITGAMGIEYPAEGLAEYAEWTRNTASAVYSDDAGTFFHFLAVYELPEGTVLDDVRSVYQSQISFTEEMMTGMGGGMIEMALLDEVYLGHDFVVFDMSMDFSELESGEVDMSEVDIPDMDFTVWMTVSDGILWAEMTSEPALTVQLIEGTYTGPMVSEVPLFVEAADAEFVMAFNLDAYFRILTGFMGSEVDMSSLPENPVWINGWVESVPEDSRVVQYNTVSGMDLAAMIGNYIPIFAGIN